MRLLKLLIVLPLAIAFTNHVNTSRVIECAKLSSQLGQLDGKQDSLVKTDLLYKTNKLMADYCKSSDFWR